eukprot:GILJ01000321.1.p1 GENE.GILJ01000321.1~~GILJ01000321.1.p1  ORF type:complete len:201 (-),score=17.85 GILJ01000321.1:196-711(-)
MTQPASVTMINRPSLIEYGKFRFLIMDAPNDANINLYVKELQKNGISDVVRTCEPSYSDVPLLNADINVLQLPFPDGEAPPRDVIIRWLDLVNTRLGKAGKDERKGIAVHCVAGLGRAPVLVAIALIEKGMDPLDAIEFIRQRRKGAINAKQLKFLESYKRRGEATCCVMM